MTIVSKKTSRLSQMWLKVLNLENSLFPAFVQTDGTLSSKEEKLIKILPHSKAPAWERVLTVCVTFCLLSGSFVMYAFPTRTQGTS